MYIEMFYWILILIWLVFGVVGAVRNKGDYYLIGGNFVVWFLFLLIGLTIFHNPLTK